MPTTSHWLFLLAAYMWYCPLGIQGFGINLMKITKEDRAPIACTIGLVKKYFRSGESLSGSVVYVTSTKAARYLQNSFIRSFHEDQQYPWTIVVKNAKMDKSADVVLHEKPQCYFSILESIEDEDIDEIFVTWKSTLNWNPLAQFVVFVATVEETEEEMTDIMIEVLLMFMNKKIFNVNILGRTESNNFIYAKTVFPYHPDNNCGNRVITTETLDICDYQGSDNDEDDKEYEEEDEGDGDGEGDGEGKGDGDGDDEGKGDGEGKGGGEGKGESKGDGEGKIEGEGKDKGDGEGDGQGDGEGKSEDEDEGKGKGKDDGKGEGQGERERESDSESKGDDQGHAERKSEGENEGEGPGVGKADGQGDGKSEGDGQGDSEGKGEGEGHAEGKSEGKDEGEGHGEGKGKGEVKSEGKGKGDGEGHSEGEHKEKKGNDMDGDEHIDNEGEEKLNNEEVGNVVSKGGNEEEGGKVEGKQFETENGADVLDENADKEMKNQNRTVNLQTDLEKTLKDQNKESEDKKLTEKKQQKIDIEHTAEQTAAKQSDEKENMTSNGNLNKKVKEYTEIEEHLLELKEFRNLQTFNVLETLKKTLVTNVIKGGKIKQNKGLKDISKGWSSLLPTIFRDKEVKLSSKLAPVVLVRKTMNLALRKYRSGKVTRRMFPTSGVPHKHEIEFFADSTKRKNYSYEKQSLPLTSAGKPEESHLYIEEMYRALFLDKFPKDLSGCPLVAAYRPWEPYIFIEPPEGDEDEPNGNNAMYGGEDGGMNGMKSYDEQMESNEDDEGAHVNVRLTGIEYKMVQTIGERLHMSINLQVENTNVYQLFQQLMDGDIEMVIGGIDEDPIISQYVSTTIPYHQDDLTWCVAKAQRSHNLFNFMATFEVDAWLLTLLFILTASFSIRMSQILLRVKITSFKNYFTACLSVMGTTLSQSVHLGRLPVSLKVSFGTLFFMSLMFSNVYQSFLISTLTNPKSSHQISQTEEIYENRMHVMGSVDNVRHLNKEGETFRYVREQFQMCYNIEECLQRTATDATLAVAVSRQHSFYNPRIPRDSLYCFDRNENIYVYLVTMLLPKKFHLLHKINPVIQHIIESGHMQKWARDLDMRRKIIEAINRAHEEKFKSLTVGQVAGPFVLIGFLLMVATFVFALERLVHWGAVRHRTRLKIAKYLHRKFS